MFCLYSFSCLIIRPENTIWEITKENNQLGLFWCYFFFSPLVFVVDTVSFLFCFVVLEIKGTQKLLGLVQTKQESLTLPSYIP